MAALLLDPRPAHALAGKTLDEPLGGGTLAHRSRPPLQLTKLGQERPMPAFVKGGPIHRVGLGRRHRLTTYTPSDRERWPWSAQDRCTHGLLWSYYWSAFEF